MAQENGDKFIWFLIGAAVGASFALLYAPQSGERTRRLLAKKAREGREVMADSGRDLLDKSRDIFERGRRVADDAAELFDRGRRIIES